MILGRRAEGVAAVALMHDDEVWQKRLAALPLTTYDVGTTVLTEGTKTGRLFILKSGLVSVVKGGTEIAQVAEPGAIFGELSALLDQPHTADVRTVETSQFHVADAARVARAGPGRAALHRDRPGATSQRRQPCLPCPEEPARGRRSPRPDRQDRRKDRRMLGAIGAGYVRAGAGYTIFPTA
jgi:hypothetical protein